MISIDRIARDIFYQRLHVDTFESMISRSCSRLVGFRAIVESDSKKLMISEGEWKRIILSRRFGTPSESISSQSLVLKVGLDRNESIQLCLKLWHV
jgi:hypothetical protein